MAIESFYFVDDEDVRRGPYPLGRIRTFPLRPDTLVWHEALPDWRPLQEVPELSAAFNAGAGAAPAPPPLPAGGWSGPGATTTLKAPVHLAGGGPAHRPAGPVIAAPPAAGGTNRAAVVALILSVASIAWWCLPGWVFVAGPLALAAVVAAGYAMYRCKDSGGKPLAITAVILSVINLVGAGIMLFIIGLFVTAEARRSGSFPTPKPPPAVPATIPTMPRFDIKQPKFPTSFPTSFPDR